MLQNEPWLTNICLDASKNELQKEPNARLAEPRRAEYSVKQTGKHIVPALRPTIAIRWFENGAMMCVSYSINLHLLYQSFSAFHFSMHISDQNQSINHASFGSQKGEMKTDAAPDTA